MERISIRQLETLVARLNDITGNPATPWTREALQGTHGDGRMVANIGNYHISQQYGGVCLHQMHNSGGGVTCPLDNYHGTKRGLWAGMHAFIRGIELEKSNV